MKSHEVLKESIQAKGAKKVASELGISTSLLYKWTEESSGDPSDERSGARNPLDRIMTLCVCTGDTGIVEWLCEQNGGFFVKNLEGAAATDLSAIESTQAMIKEFSDLLGAVSKGLADDKRISEQEARKIRKEWEELKRKAEGFVMGCEEGVY